MVVGDIMERLQKIIANKGYCSRRKAEVLITEGKVTVNGKVITELGYKANSNDDIEVNGIKLDNEEKKYFLFYKPKLVLSTTNDDRGRKTILDFFNIKERIYPIGRLDYDTTGIILLTNDGEFANLMMHPRGEIEKVYTAKIDGLLNGTIIKTLESGVIIDNKKTSPAKIKVRKVDKVKKASIVEITIHEGKYHQVKRMFEVFDLKVMKLKRERIAFLNLMGLKEGEYRRLTIKEVRQLYNLANKK
jgi:23S rRNA pseudouridine2605 synthase